MSTEHRPTDIFVEGKPRSHHTVTVGVMHPEDAGEHILRIVGEALRAEGVEFQVTAFEALSPTDAFSMARVKFGIRLNGKDL